MNAIPTVYRSIQFRSRLEATWAAFFDECGWTWEYEPLDLDGWIPDFLLTPGRRQVFVEVKPITALDDLLAAGYWPKIENAKPELPTLLVGCCLFSERVFPEIQGDTFIGWLRESRCGNCGVPHLRNGAVCDCCDDEDPTPSPAPEFAWSQAYLGWCNSCGQIAFCGSLDGMGCNPQSCCDGPGHIFPTPRRKTAGPFKRVEELAGISRRWATAKNATQWRHAG